MNSQNTTSDNELQFPMHLFLKTEAEWVDELPHDINGFKLYKIKCSPQEWIQKSQDLRYFKMNTSRRKDLIGTRKVGRCIRSLYCMSADCPFKHSAEGKLNTMNFQNVSGNKVCFSCGNIASRKWCSACKMTEYCRESETLIVYHIGGTNVLLGKTQIYTERSEKQCTETEVWVLKVFNRLRWVRQLLMVTFWRQRRAMQLSCACVRSEKAKILQERNPHKHSLEAVGILKQAMDKEDKYLIYKINNSQFNGQPDYIFKNSASMAQLAIDMDQDSLKHPLQAEEAYFNGCHSRCAVYKTLALFVYHTTMHCILWLPTMEAKSDFTCEISILWELFNEILIKIKVRNYKFNPKSIMVDENGANYCAVRKVFGLEICNI